MDVEFSPSQIIEGLLSEVAGRQDYSPRELHSREMPKVIVRPNGAVEVEEAFLKNDERLIYFGDSHGLIFPMLNHARKHGLITLPILGGIVNADYHADVAEYTPSTISHTGSWERYGVDKGFWDKRDAYNFRPDNSTAGPYSCIRAFSTEIDSHQAENVLPEVLSVDLDFFQKIKQGTPEYSTYLELLKKMARSAKIVMVFSSAGWNYDYVKSVAYQSKEQIEDIVRQLQSQVDTN